MVRTKSSICSSASAGGFTSTSMPSPSTLSSKSVTRAATSISASAPRSSPVISQSIHTSRSFTLEPYSGRSQRSFLQWNACAGRAELGGSRRPPRGRRRLGRRRGRSSCRTRPPASAPSAPTSCCRRASSRSSATPCPCWRSWSGSACSWGCSPGSSARRLGAACWSRSWSASPRPGRGACRSSAAASAAAAARRADATAAYPWDIARDVGLLLLSLWLVWRPATPWAADNRLLAPAAASTRHA